MSGPAYLTAFLVAAAAAAWFLRRAAAFDRRGADFLIRKERGRVTIVGRIPKGRDVEVREFLARHSESLGAFSLRGTWEEGRRLRLDWKGDVAPGTRQRMRNFLIELLG